MRAPEAASLFLAAGLSEFRRWEGGMKKDVSLRGVCNALSQSAFASLIFFFSRENPVSSEASGCSRPSGGGGVVYTGGWYCSRSLSSCE